MLDSFYGGSRISLDKWIVAHSLQLVGDMNPNNFQTYEDLGLPMLLTFLDYNTKKKSMRKKNRKMIKILNKIAKKFINEIKFATVDVRKYENKMKSLGLFGGIESVPCSAINVEGGGIFPLDQINKKNAMNKRYIHNYLNEFLAGRIESLGVYELAKRAKIINKRIKDKKEPKQGIQKNKKNSQKVKYKKGVREKFDALRDDIVTVSRLGGESGQLSTYEKVALDETKDVLILFHDNEPESEYLAPYYKKLATRFKELKIKSVVIARFDLGYEPAPSIMNAQLSANNRLPMMVLFKAFNKNPPFLVYSGVGKVQPIMQWVEQNAGVRFKLPHLAQFDDLNKKKFKDQVEILYGSNDL